MAQQTTSRPLSPDTLSRLGLLSQPFVEPDEPGFVFSDAAHRTQLNVALQLLQASDRVLVIRGEPGMGKTAFLVGLTQKQGTGLRFCRVQCDERLEFEPLLRRLLTECGLASADEEPSVSDATARLTASARAGARPVLLLDDAHHLADATLARLLSLRAATVAEAAQFGLVLAVEPAFAARLENLKNGALSADQLHSINLFPFSEKQTADYVAQHLAAAGEVTGGLLSEADLHAIHERSLGAPARVNAETVRVLNEKAGGAKAGLGRSLRVGRRPLLIAAGAAVAVVAGVAVWLGLSSRPSPEPTPSRASTPGNAYGVKVPERYGFDKTPSQPQVVESPPGVPLVPRTEPAPAGQAKPQSEVAAAPAAGAPRQPSTTSPQPTEPKPEPAPIVVAEPQRIPPPTPRPSAEPPAAAKPAPAAPSVAVRPTPPPAAAPVQTKPSQIAPAPAERAVSSIRGNEWLKGKDPEHFTVQLIGAYDRDALHGFVREHGLEGTAAVIRTRREGKDWYVVVNGDYASFRQANAAIAKLPKSLRASGAFARRFNSIAATDS